jgi:peptidoglycan/xylan/chitin deacetylase (PgdA/CDA1 family)
VITQALVAAIAALLLLVAVFLVRPQWIAALLAKGSAKVVWLVPTQEPVVALTIDDGPDADTTPGILDLLRKQSARATFFVITERVAGNEDLLARVVEEGHELGNHLNSDDPSILLDPSEFERQLLASHRVLAQFADVCWFRPGSGWFNAPMLSVLRRQGYRCVLGTVYPFDAQIGSERFAARYVLRNVRPGSIIILHDHGGRGMRTTAALATILPEVKRRGLRVVTLSELFGEGPGESTDFTDYTD